MQFFVYYCFCSALGGFFLRNERGELALHGPRPHQVLSFVRYFVSNRLGEAPTTRFGVPAVWVCPSPQRFRAPTTEPVVESKFRNSSWRALQASLRTHDDVIPPVGIVLGVNRDGWMTDGSMVHFISAEGGRSLPREWSRQSRGP